MVPSVQFKGTWFLCILGVFLVLYWLLVITEVNSERCMKRQRTAIFIFIFFPFVR